MLTTHDPLWLNVFAWALIAGWLWVIRKEVLVLLSLLRVFVMLGVALVVVVAFLHAVGL